jgi:myo-inositol-1(or 4)-monophosphatase
MHCGEDVARRQHSARHVAQLDAPSRLAKFLTGKGSSAVDQTACAGFASLLDFAHRLADLSGAEILPYFRTALAVEDKALEGAFDPVTAADRGAEQVLRAEVARRFPEHGFIGEELGTTRSAARYRWVVDPIDGTRAFIMGSPLWGTLIGLLDGDIPLLGLMDQPHLRERFWSDAASSHMRGTDGRVLRLATRACPRLADALLSTTHPDLFEPGAEASGFARLKSAVRMTRYGGDCYAYGLLAAGFVDLVVEAGLKPHDIVALVPIVERAGGCITTWEGRDPSEGGRILASGDRRLHEAALHVLSA